MPSTLTILGCGSAVPTRKNNPSGQILDVREKQFLIDCGEGVQHTIRQMGQRTNRLDHIFISHLHGDHCYGLMGLITTLSMLGRTRDIYIHAQPDLEKLLRPQLDYFCKDMAFEVIFANYNPRKHEVIYQDRSVTVTTLPLKHRVPTCGFLFEEAPTRNAPGTRYAYCSDTAYKEKLVDWIEGVDCLYHEATYTEEFASRAKQTQHSTALQAATIAKKAAVKKLIIGHFSARIDDQNDLLKEAQTVFPETYLAQERESFKL